MRACMLGRSPVILVFLLILAGCYDTFTREDLPPPSMLNPLSSGLISPTKNLRLR